MGFKKLSQQDESSVISYTDDLIAIIGNSLKKISVETLVTMLDAEFGINIFLSAETKQNKVTSLSESSDNAHYASAKAVVDYVSALISALQQSVDEEDAKRLLLSGGTMTGNINMSNKRIQNVFELELSSGGSGNQSRITGHNSVLNGISVISGLGNPSGATEATRKQYVDDADALSEKLANKATVIDDNADNTKYPTVLAVKNAIQAAMYADEDDEIIPSITPVEGSSGTASSQTGTPPTPVTPVIEEEGGGE